jgi:hypothetical protein
VDAEAATCGSKLARNNFPIPCRADLMLYAVRNAPFVVPPLGGSFARIPAKAGTTNNAHIVPRAI